MIAVFDCPFDFMCEFYPTWCTECNNNPYYDKTIPVDDYFKCCKSFMCGDCEFRTDASHCVDCDPHDPYCNLYVQEVD